MANLNFYIDEIIKNSDKQIENDIRDYGIPTVFTKLDTFDLDLLMDDIYDIVINDLSMIEYLQDTLEINAENIVNKYKNDVLTAITNYLNPDELEDIYDKLYLDSESITLDDIHTIVYNCLLYDEMLIIDTSLYIKLVDEYVNIIFNSLNTN